MRTSSHENKLFQTNMILVDIDASKHSTIIEK